MLSRQNTSVRLLALLCLGIAACKPVIYNFTATPLTVSSADSIFIKWKVRGDATLVLHDRTQAGPDSSRVLRELTLVVRDHGKEISQKVQVVILADTATDRIVFTTNLEGNNLVARGTKDTVRWGSAFIVNTVSNSSGRVLEIRHAGKSVHLENNKVPSRALAGTPVNGTWELVSPLSAKEQADHSLLPDRLAISITLTHI